MALEMQNSFHLKSSKALLLCAYVLSVSEAH